MNLESLEPVFKLQISSYLQTLERTGIKYSIIDARRSFEAQSHAFFVQKKPGTVPPDESFHVRGRAVDISFQSFKQRETAREIARSHGLFVIDEDRFGYSHLHIDNRHTPYPETKKNSALKTGDIVLITLLFMPLLWSNS